jgi:hypothetical protein
VERYNFTSLTLPLPHKNLNWRRKYVNYALLVGQVSQLQTRPNRKSSAAPNDLWCNDRLVHLLRHYSQQGERFLPQDLVNTNDTKTNFRSLLQNTVYRSRRGQIAPRCPKTVLSKTHCLNACDSKTAFPSLISLRYPTPCSSFITETPAVPQPVKKFPALYGTRRFITAFTTVRQLSLS